MTKQLYVIAAVCLWLLSACQSSTYKYEAVYKDLPFDMPRVEAPKFPDRKVQWVMAKNFVRRLLPRLLMPWRKRGADI